jgi:PPOX class probable F420-dependent enzyme
MASDEARQAFLAEPQLGVLSTVGRDGGPHAVPIWYLYEDGVIRISVSEGSQKHRNVERDPRVALAVDRRERPYYALTALGAATIEPSFGDEERLRLATRYLGEAAAQEYLKNRGPGGSVTIQFRPDRFFEFESPV